MGGVGGGIRGERESWTTGKGDIEVSECYNWV